MCGAELECIDYYGNRVEGKVGDIYLCPNHEGFNTVEDVQEYLDLGDDELDGYLSVNCLEGWEEIQCDSSCHGGHFYTDKQGNLHEGYPC